MSATFFSATYREARQRFLDAAHRAGATADSHVHPLKGAEGEEIGTDTALLGAADADKLFIVSSGTHGPEGFSGSACQLSLLNDELARRANDRGVGADLLPLGAPQRMHMRVDGSARLASGVEEALSRLAIGGREENGAHLIFSSK